MVSRFDAEVSLRKVRNNSLAMEGAARFCLEKRDIGMCDFAETLYRDLRTPLREIRAFVRGR